MAEGACRELLQPQPWATPATPIPVPQSLINYIFLCLKTPSPSVSNPTEIFSPSSLHVSALGWARFGSAEHRDEHCCQPVEDTSDLPGNTLGLHLSSSLRAQVLNRVCVDQPHGKHRIREKQDKWGFSCGCRQQPFQTQLQRGIRIIRRSKGTSH